MSVARRRDDLQPALEVLGYRAPEARRIVLDAPLDIGMTDQQALATALRYAAGITPEETQAEGSWEEQEDGGVVMPGEPPVKMPPSAQRALRGADFRAQPVRGFAGGLRNFSRGAVDRLLSWWNPLADRISDAPIPGGIGGMLLANLLFLGVIVPANAQGYPRIQLLWAAMGGKLRWANGIGVPTKQPVPPSALIAAITGAAIGIEEIAQVVGGPADKAAQVAHAAESAGGGLLQQFIHGLPPGLQGAGVNKQSLTTTAVGVLSDVTPPAAGSNGSPPPVSPSALPPSPPPTMDL